MSLFFDSGTFYEGIKSKKEYKEYVKQDKLANGFSNRSLAGKIRHLLFPNPVEKFLLLLRKFEYLNNTINQYKIIKYLRLFFVIKKFKKLSLKLGFSIPKNTFAAGLSIPHYGTIVVNGNARIGRNCRLHAGVNIGASAGKKESPKIGDNVYLGPGAILFGNIEIADNVTIGANATVNKSCMEKNCVLAGTPAQIVKKNFPVWWVNNGVPLQ